MSDPILTNYTYNLSTIMSEELITAPNNWLAAFNTELGGYFFITSLLIVGVFLFIITKNMGVKDSEGAVYSGLVISVAGLLLFLIDTGDYDKLITWPQLFIILTITGISILVNHIRQRY